MREGEEKRRREEGPNFSPCCTFFCERKTLNELFNPTVAVIMVTESWFRSDW